MPQQWQTVAIPFAEGIKSVANGRLLEQTKLLTAQNCFFSKDQGPEKRHGHTVRPVRANGTPIALNGVELPGTPGLRPTFDQTDPNLGETYLHGFGINWFTTEPVTDFTVSEYLDPGHVFGGWKRDNQVVAWDGWRAFSVPDTASEPFGEVMGEAVLPALRGAPIAKSLNGQFSPDAVDNGVSRTVVWVDEDGVAYRSVYYSASGTCVVHEEALEDIDSASNVRVFSMGAWTHVLADNSGDTSLYMFSWHNDDPNNVTQRIIGEITSTIFDVRKYDELIAAVVRINADQPEIKIIRTDGSTVTDYTPDTDGDVVTTVAMAINSDSELGLLWVNDAAEAKFNAYDLLNGSAFQTTAWDVASNANTSRITICDTYVPVVGGGNAWIAYIQREDLTSTASIVDTYLLRKTNTVVTGITRYNVVIASHAFRVGQRTYLWCALNPTIYTLQPTWFLCDQQLQPVGKVLFGTAYQTGYLTIGYLPSVNWCASQSHPSKDRVVFSGAVGYRQRASSSVDSPDPNGVWAESSIFFYELDFLPRLRSAQAGRSTYIAGAQLWEFDGVSLNEAGFHATAENVSISTGAAGNLDISKTYNYRIDLCYKNAQNEEIRSWSKIFTRTGSGAGNNKLSLIIPHMPMTRRDGAYWLIFRTEGNGTEYYLVSSRDPSATGDNGFVANSRTSKEYTFVDNIADTALIDNEYHPANATGYLQPLPAPACETIAAGRDRLWLAGGELAPGEIAASRYFLPGETPSFSPAINLQIDRNAEPITAIGFVGEQAVFFRRTSAYTMSADGPDNLAQGVWPICQLALADVGAISQETLALAGDGLYFQSPAGFRVITQGGGLRPPGAGLIGGLGTDVDTLSQEGDYSAAIVASNDSQIRWYSRNPDKPTLVVDYTKNIWVTWTGLTCQAAFFSPGLQTTVLLRSDAKIFTEDSDSYLDGDRAIEMVIKTAWLHGGNLGDFERFKRFTLYGEASSGLNLQFRLYYDERPFFEQEETVQFIGENPNTLFNPSIWGGVQWGFGPWGDESAQTNTGVGSGLYFRDGLFKLRKRTDRQKCSVFAIEFTDMGSQARFIPTVLAIELGLKPGLERIAT